MGLFALKREIGPDTILERNSNLVFNQIEGEVVMLSLETSAYYGMDKIGSRIWELMEKPVSFSKILSHLMEEYNVSKEQCSTETKDFINKLIEKKLVIAG